jgi:prepilin-type N-terminal cleavage/methylation domain-containing protein
VSVSDRQGFSLIEVVIAVGILACAVAAATVVVPNGTAARHRAETLQQGRLAVDNELESLAALPFCSEGPSIGGSEVTLVGRVFPHAVAARNTSQAFYRGVVSAGPQDGTFVSVRDEAGGTLRTTARFLVSGSTGWVAVEPADTQGFVADDECPPSSVVEVTAAWSSGADAAVTVCETAVVFVAR